ncbi:venom prothrombin activator oscutarin-C non-catalytic subunit-like [Haliotis rubra]|uniref:venom prothrombin activator oscutarin-C non-catalytic subunit-like n=1 Tax=Haliotis rubra TaxID=36100 RepID=UPI001EE52E4F|nr:venom prothrombin activator oscutarin-C non-catalytic subunit-like [Haliotis rubra]
MWNGTIKDSQLVASSSSSNNGKEKARYLCCFGETKGAWCPDKDDRAPYYEVHLNKPYLVAMIMFEHPNTLNYWEVPDSFLNTFTLQYRNVYQDAMETYAVNIDAIYNSSISLSPMFDPFILTDVIRIVPSKWTNEPCFRFEIIGCDPDQGPVDNPLPTTKSPFFNPGVIVGRRKRGIYFNRPANTFP